MTAKLNIFHKICEEPYRLFFPLGILMGLIGVGHWLFYAMDWTKSYSGFFHSSTQIQAYISSFVIGFLTTAMPRFACAPHATPLEICCFLSCILGVCILSSLDFWIASELCFVGIMIMLGLFAIKRISKRQSTSHPPVEFIWIPIAIFHAVIGSVVLILSQLDVIPRKLLGIGKALVDQGFILSIVLGVGGFLSPRLMGHFQAIAFAPNLKPEIRYDVLKQRRGVHLILGILFFLSFWLEAIDRSIGYLLRSCIVTGIFSWTRSWPRPPKAPDLFLWLLWISINMLVLGHWAVVFLPKYRVEMLHIVFIGGLSLMTFAIATMVIMSHAGEPHQLRRPHWVLWLVLIGLASAVGFRILAAFFPRIYFQLLGWASVFWITAASFWLIYTFQKIFKIPPLGEFERFHKEAKQRIQKS